MKKIFTKYNISRALLLVFATAIISLCLPRNDKFSYSYNLGKPWAYSLLTAPFDIPIELDTASVRTKRDSIDRSFIDIYKFDTETSESQLSAFKDHLDSLKITISEKNKIQNRLQQIYNDGIVDNATFDKIRLGELPNIRFIADNNTYLSPTDKLKSVKSAYASIDSIDGVLLKTIHEVGIANYLSPNVIIDETLSLKLREAEYQKALAPIGLLQKGERIVDRGEIINIQTFTILNTYQQMELAHNDGAVRKHYPLAGKILIILILFGSVYIFLYMFRWRFFGDFHKMTFLMCLFTVFTVAALIIARHTNNALYVMPFAMIPILITTFFDSRTALYMHIHEVLMCSLLASFPIEFIFLQFMAGVIAICSVRELSKRAQLMRAGIYVFICYCISYFAFELMKEGVLIDDTWRMYAYFAVNAIFLSLSYILIFVIEKLFGFTSTVTLVELADVNNPLLREISEKCPGTFQHALQVSNLSADAARRIHADVQLARVGALYHDIGKLNNPAFFTENQHGVNPHSALTPEQSAEIVINHVRDGLKLADKAKLPQVVIDFIAQHHGKGKAKYFYTLACNAADDMNTVDASVFTYPGPNPSNKETSILMMADAVEAASRSLKEYNDDNIRNLVNKIIDSQIADGLFIDSPLSFRDIQIIKEVFIERLKTTYHTRISYPELKNSANTKKI